MSPTPDPLCRDACVIAAAGMPERRVETGCVPVSVIVTRTTSGSYSRRTSTEDPGACFNTFVSDSCTTRYTHSSIPAGKVRFRPATV